MNYDTFDPDRLAIIDHVVEALRHEVGLNPATIMVLGAECRDIIHAALGHTFSLRSTTDLDLGIAMVDWDAYRGIEARMERIGHTGIQYRIAGVSVDLMPFGNVEDPPGTVTPITRNEGIVVFGFEDIFVRADRLSLPSGATVRIPQPAGYAALKMRAWLDRSADYEFKDALDLAAVAYWYQETEALNSKMWDDEHLMTSTGFDGDLASMEVLGRDVAAQLAEQNRGDLERRWLNSDLGLLAENLRLPAEASWRPELKRRTDFINKLSAGLNDGFRSIATS